MVSLTEWLDATELDAAFAEDRWSVSAPAVAEVFELQDAYGKQTHNLSENTVFCAAAVAASAATSYGRVGATTLSREAAAEQDMIERVIVWTVPA